MVPALRLVPSSFAAVLLAGAAATSSAACTIDAPGAADGTPRSATPVDVPADATVAESYCTRTCLAADVDNCLGWASNHSDAFLRAYETCGNDVACLELEVTPAPRTAAATELARTYCARCADPGGTEACVAGFYDGQTGAGWAPLVYADAKLDEIGATCFADREEGKGSSLTLPLCQMDLNQCLKDRLPSTRVICRPR